MNCKEKLKEYINKDEIYQNYKQNKLMNPSDFDKFCIQHCKDIEELLEENLELEQALDEIEKYIEEYQEERIYTDRGGFTCVDGHILWDSDDLLKIIKNAKGNVKNENNNVWITRIS